MPVMKLLLPKAPELSVVVRVVSMLTRALTVRIGFMKDVPMKLMREMGMRSVTNVKSFLLLISRQRLSLDLLFCAFS